MKKKLLRTSLFLSAIIITAIVTCSGCGSNSVNGPNSPNNTDTSFINYIIITPMSGPADTLHFTGRNHVTGSYSSSSNDTYCLLNDTATFQSVSLTFNGNTTGSPAFTFGFLSYHGGSYNGAAISGAVTLYEDVGGKIKGTFNGTFSGGSVTYGCSGAFTVYRTQ